MPLTFSNSDRWFRCPASETPHASRGGNISAGTDEQIEGRAAAWVAECVLSGTATEALELIGRVSPHGWEITADMAKHVQGYIDTVRAHGTPVKVELDLMLFNGMVIGRPDSHTAADEQILHVYELKYGYRIVEPETLIQLWLAAAALSKPHHNAYMLHVYQPRGYHPAGIHRAHMIGRGDLERFQREAWQSALDVHNTPHVARPGEHCTYCPRRTACATLQNNIAAMIEVIGVPEERDRTLTPEELAQRYTMLKNAKALISAAMSGVNGEIESRLKSREYLHGFYLGDTYSRDRQWNCDPADKYGEDAYKTVLKTPAEMEREGFEVDGMTHRPYTGQSVKEWNSNDIKRWFKD